MKFLRYILVLIPLLISLSVEASLAQNASEAPTYAGTEYFISFPLSDPNKLDRFMGLMITSEVTTNGTIEIPDIPTDPLVPITTWTTQTFSIQAGEVKMIPILRTLEPDYPGRANHNGEASKRSVRLTSRAPISVSVISARQASSGVYSLLPVDRWGKNYLVTALPATSTPSSADPNEITSQLAITAAYDETIISVYPSANVSQWSAGERIRDTLNRGETWLLLANTAEGTRGSMDLSGTLIESSKPVGVVAGHSGTALSSNPTERFNNQVYSAWHATMQMPTDTEANQWGQEYVATPTRNDGDRFRIVTLRGGTTIQVSLYDNTGKFIDQRSISAQWAGQVIDIFAPEGMQLNGPTRWTADKPFMLTQIRRSNGNYPNVEASPAFIRLVPTTSYSAHSVFALPLSIISKDTLEFRDFDLDLVAKGAGNPFDNITLDGMPVSSIPNSTVARITGDLWSFKGKVAPGGHALHASNGILFSGRVSGDNGSTPEGNISIAWELPHWSVQVEADVTPPRIVEKTTPTTNQVNVIVSDQSQSYFSGVDEVAPYNSPGWERKSFDRPFDPEFDAEALFKVKPGVDPSGPLTLLLRDRDGNETTTQVHDGICLQTAYLATDSVSLFVGGSGGAKEVIRINANPCGDIAHLQWMEYDLGGSANQYLQDPSIVGGGTPSYTISANGYVEITVETNPNLPQIDHKVFQTKLELRIDDEIYSIPVRLEIDNVSGLREEEVVAGSEALQVSPNPFTTSTTISLSSWDKSTQIAIVDALGSAVRTYGGSAVNGRETIEWDGRDESGNLLPAGVYIVRVSSLKGTATSRVLLVR
ncbi:MAG: T9SS type A sorting domain-containing protein [Candidatus Kapaibacterium sp.]